MNLAIDVGLGDMVEVNQGQSGDAATSERFGSPRPHAAQSDDHGMPLTNALSASGAVKPGKTAKATLQISTGQGR